MNIVSWQSQDRQPSAALKIIFKLLFETAPSQRAPGPWWSELFGQRPQRDWEWGNLSATWDQVFDPNYPFAQVDWSVVAVHFSLISLGFRFQRSCWPTWEWTRTLITVQYFFILWKSLSSCFCPVSSCHFLLYLVKAFFLLLYLNQEEWTWDPVQVRCADKRRDQRWLHAPVFIKSALALIAEVLCKDGFERAKAVDGLDVSHNPDDNDRWSFNDGDCLNFFPLWLFCRYEQGTTILYFISSFSQKYSNQTGNVEVNLQVHPLPNAKHPIKSCNTYWAQCGAPPSACGSCQPCSPRRQWGGLDGWDHLWATCAPVPGASCFACGAESPCVHVVAHGTSDETNKGILAWDFQKHKPKSTKTQWVMLKYFTANNTKGFRRLRVSDVLKSKMNWSSL